VAGWPLGKPARLGRVEMVNLIGAEVNEAAHWLTVPGASLHLYGKSEARPGRKMGHVTRVWPK
jgi:5-(carboxyamino)imidazole ribonucleotide synthase